MGIQGLNGYLENTAPKICNIFDKTDSDNDTYKYLYFDFQSMVYTIFTYVETIINFQYSIIHKIESINMSIDNDISIKNDLDMSFHFLEKIRLLIKNTKLGDLLFNYKFMMQTLRGNVEKNIDIREKTIKFVYDSTYENIQVINDIKKGLDLFKEKKMEYIKLIIIDEIKKIIDNFKNLESCVIVFDGKPFVAKMVEQVKRRVTTFILDDILTDFKKSIIDTGLLNNMPPEIIFERYVITRDSELMVSLIDNLKSINFDRPFTLEVIDSEDGEGEHIINKKILRKIDDDIDGNFLYYSPDGDVTLLTMILNMKIREKGKTNHVDIIRLELIDFNSYKFNYKINNTNLLDYVYSTEIDFDTKKTAISELLNQIKLEFYITKTLEFEKILTNDIIDKCGIINNGEKKILKINELLIQYITLFGFFGNDFIPKLSMASVGKIEEIIKMYNKYLLNTREDINNYLNNDTNTEIHKFKFLINPHTYKIDQKVYLDIIKLLVKTKSKENDEKNMITIQLNRESQKTTKNFTEYITTFLNKSYLFNYYGSNLTFIFLKFLLEGNYYLEIKNLNLNEDYIAYIQSIKDKIDELSIKKHKTTEEQAEFNQNQDLYYNFIFSILQQYLGYLYGTGFNPLNVQFEDVKIKGFTTPHRTTGLISLVSRKVPFSEIINYNNEIDDSTCAKQYLEGFQYTADLYFTGNVKNKCWHYQCEHAPTVTSLIKYISENLELDIFEYATNYFYYDNQEELYNSISQRFSRNSNIKYNRFLKPAKYYLINDIFNCFNERYINKCPVNGDTTFIPISHTGDFVNIISRDYDITEANQKLQTTLMYAQRSLGGGFYDKYIKYKLKYLQLKKHNQKN